MTEGSGDRRLAAVLAADMVGYTKLMEENTDGTLAAWKAARHDVIAPSIARHAGRVVKHTGDGFLAEFSSVRSAVECAVALQDGLSDSVLKFRIGVNLGDIIDDGEDIYGEGINIAARIEALADPGGISISGGAYDQVRNQLDYNFEDRGYFEVKHVTAPVRIFAIHLHQTLTEPAKAPATNRNPGVRPAIAILPMKNMSGDEEQEYFADGMTEDIITELSKFRWLTVIARNSTFVYKGQAVDIPKVAKELDVGYVLEGSVRKSGERVRITARLIEAATNEHIWAGRYDRRLDDIFDLQDEITQTLVGMIESELANRERRRTRDKPTKNMNAWELYQRGLFHRWRYTPDDIKRAHEYFDEAIVVDPDFAAAYAHRAWTFYIELMMSLVEDRAAARAAGIADGRRAVKLDDRDPLGYCALGFILTDNRNYSEAKQNFRRALEFNPSFSIAHYGLALSLVYVTYENRDEALQAIETAIRLSPNDPMMWVYLNLKGLIFFEKEDYDQALQVYQRSSQFPNIIFWIPVGLAACLFRLGEKQRAREIITTALADYPGVSVSWIASIMGPAISINENYLDAIRSAGLPETSSV